MAKPDRDEYDNNLITALKWHARHNESQKVRILFAQAAARIMKLTKA